MSDLVMKGRVGPGFGQDGVEDSIRLERTLGQVVQDAHGRYFEASSRGKLYVAQAIVTAPVVYSTAAATGGPLIWNPSNSGVNVVPVAVGYGITVVTTVAAALGLTGNSGQTSAPTSTTAIDGQAALYIGGAVGQAKAYRIGTPANAGSFLLPIADLHTGALTVDTGTLRWVDVGGILTAPPGTWFSLAASVTASTTVGTFAVVYEEIPV